MRYTSRSATFYLILKTLFHQFFMSVFGFTHVCTKQPSCSEYLVEQIKTHGTMRGSWRGIKRIATCW